MNAPIPIPEKIFRAYDVRGRYPAEISPAVVETVARALAAHFRRGCIVLAHDGRTSSGALFQALVRGFAGRRGLRLVKAHLTTTPMFTFLVNDVGARGGIMVTASHNPREYNGLKVVGRGAAPIGGKEILRMTKRFLRHQET
jgi:phosphomannomutase